MLEDGLSYPMQGDNWVGRMLIGGIIIFFSFLLFPAFLFYGYLLRVLGDSIEGATEPPEWDDWGELLVDGIKASVVAMVYALVPTVVFLGIGVTMLGIGGAAGDSGGGILAGFGAIFFLLLIPVMFLVYYLLPAALANMVVEDSFGAAFDFSTIKEIVVSGEYLVAILMPIVVGMIVNVVSFFLGITIIGYLLVPFVSFYGQVAIFRMFGLAVGKELGRIDESPSPATAPA